jgi:hypothetical protein
LEVKDKPKANVNLSIDSHILKIIRAEAQEKGISLNSRINAIMSKYVNFYKRAEEVDDTCIIPKKYFQFAIDNIDEKDNRAQVAEMHRIWIPALFNELNIPFTLDNFIKYAVKQVGVNSRTIDSMTNYTDDEGNIILAFTHRFGLKWSKALSAGVATVIEELLHYKTECSNFSASFTIKIMKRGSKFS